MDLQTDAIDRYARRINESQENELRSALETNAWNIFPILDYVITQPELSTGWDTDRFTVDTTTAVRRYESPAPPLSESSIKGRRCSIQRWTKPLYDKMRSEYPEAFARQEPR